MPVRVITPAVAAVTLAEAQAHLRVSGGTDDAVIAALIAAAQGQIDGPDGWLGRAIGVQTLELSLPSDTCQGWAPYDWIALPCPPVRSVVSVVYVSGSTPVTIDPADYVFGPGNAVRPAGNTRWPWAWPDMASVRVQFEAGYDADKVPAPIKVAILLMVQDLYGKRSRDPSLTVDTVIGVQSQQYAVGGAPILTDTAKSLLAPFRVWSL